MPAEQINQITPAFFRQALDQFIELLSENEQKINELNVYPVPDSDTGTNSLITLKAGLANLAGESVPELANSLANGASDKALGNSGVILAAYLTGLAGELSSQQAFGELVTNPHNWQAALNAAANTARAAVLHPAQGTMLSIADSVSVDSVETLTAQLSLNSKLARTALIKTQSQLPELTKAGVVDAGAVVLTLFHDAFAKLISNSNFELLNISALTCGLSKSNFGAGYDGPMHELMFNIELPIDQKSNLVELLEASGDSIALTENFGFEKKSANQNEELIHYRVHVHCDNPDSLVQQVKLLGQVSDLVLINLKLKMP